MYNNIVMYKEADSNDLLIYIKKEYCIYKHDHFVIIFFTIIIITIFDITSEYII